MDAGIDAVYLHLVRLVTGHLRCVPCAVYTVPAVHARRRRVCIVLDLDLSRDLAIQPGDTVLDDVGILYLLHSVPHARGDAMPGKQKRDKNEKNLTRLQSKIAGNVLKPHFDPKLGERQWDESAKRQLVEAVNKEFAAQAQDAVYTVRKLEDWVSNAIYRWRKQQQREAAAAAAAAAPGAARAGGTVAPPPAVSPFHPGPAAAPVPSATFVSAPAAVGRPPVRKRERVLSNVTMKPSQKQVRADVPSGE